MNKREALIKLFELIENGVIKPSDIKHLPEYRLEAITAELSPVIGTEWDCRQSYLATLYKDIDTDKEYTPDQVKKLIALRVPYVGGIVAVSEKSGSQLITTHIFLRKISKYEQAGYLVKHYEDAAASV